MIQNSKYLGRTTAAPQSQRGQRGFSLIELMIALAIGLLIMATVITIYVASSRTSRTAEMESQMNEDGLIALNIIQQQIRMAGYSNFENPATTDKSNFKGAGIIGCSTAAMYPNASTQKLLTALTDADCTAASTLGDGVIIRYEADRYNTVQNTAGAATVPTNCLIQAAITVPAAGTTPQYRLAENRYYVASSTTNPFPAVYCAGGTGAMPDYTIQMQPILDNVEKMELRYGISATNEPEDTQIVTYLTASDINAAFASETVDDRWRRVVSVKICLRMRSAEPLTDIAATATYRDCDGTQVTQTTPDGYLHRAFITTASVRNRLTITDRNRKNES